MTKLMPTYTQKLDESLQYNGCHRNLFAWQKSFKQQWMRCKYALITDPDDPKYATNPQRWVCTCPAFIRSQFLICKHLVQSMHPVTPRFFIEVTCRRTTPLWRHPDLCPLSENLEDMDPETDVSDAEYQPLSSILPNEEEDNNLPTTNCEFLLSRATFDESLDHRILQLQDFVKALEHQRQFRDPRFLLQPEQQGSSFFRYIGECQELEKQMESRASPRPRNSEGGSRTMFYRTQPRHQDID